MTNAAVYVKGIFTADTNEKSYNLGDTKIKDLILTEKSVSGSHEKDESVED